MRLPSGDALAVTVAASVVHRDVRHLRLRRHRLESPRSVLSSRFAWPFVATSYELAKNGGELPDELRRHRLRSARRDHSTLGPVTRGDRPADGRTAAGSTRARRHRCRGVPGRRGVGRAADRRGAHARGVERVRSAGPSSRPGVRARTVPSRRSAPMPARSAAALAGNPSGPTA